MSRDRSHRSHDDTRGSSSRRQPSYVGYDPYETSYGTAYTGQRPTSGRTNYHGSHTYRSHEYGAQVQTQEHIFRPAQASKQMVYDVYGNTLTMLEELESRELREQGTKSLGRSDIHLPSQSAHDTATIQRKLDTQLLLLQSQLESCDKGILGDVKEGLKETTLDWASQRQAHKVKRGKADKYTGKLYEVLATGKTEHPDEFYKTPSISERDMQKSMGAFMHGSQIRHNLDSGFRNDPNRQAVAPRVREGAGTYLGAERMIKERPDLETDIKRFGRFDNR